MTPDAPTEKVAFVRQLRREQTPYERKLWEILRAHRLSGFHFRRQHAIGPFITDFACAKARLIIELDGNSHDERLERDSNRDQFLRDLGWRILRFPNTYARDHPEDLWRTIEIELLKTDE